MLRLLSGALLSVAYAEIPVLTGSGVRPNKFMTTVDAQECLDNTRILKVSAVNPHPRDLASEDGKDLLVKDGKLYQKCTHKKRPSQDSAKYVCFHNAAKGWYVLINKSVNDVVEDCNVPCMGGRKLRAEFTQFDRVGSRQHADDESPDSVNPKLVVPAGEKMKSLKFSMTALGMGTGITEYTFVVYFTKKIKYGYVSVEDHYTNVAPDGSFVSFAKILQNGETLSENPTFEINFYDLLSKHNFEFAGVMGYKTALRSVNCLQSGEGSLESVDAEMTPKMEMDMSEYRALQPWHGGTWYEHTCPMGAAGVSSPTAPPVIVDCGPGFYEQDLRCYYNQCECKNGKGTSGVDCGTHGSMDCVACRDGFELTEYEVEDGTWDASCEPEPKKCQEGTHKEEDGECHENICACINGRGATGRDCPRHKGFKCAKCYADFDLCKFSYTCVSCRPGFTLTWVRPEVSAEPGVATPTEAHFECIPEPEDVECTEGTHRMPDGGCERNKCYCQYGFVSRDLMELCPTHKLESCHECYEGYAMTDDGTCNSCDDGYVWTWRGGTRICIVDPDVEIGGEDIEPATEVEECPVWTTVEEVDRPDSDTSADMEMTAPCKPYECTCDNGKPAKFCKSEGEHNCAYCRKGYALFYYYFFLTFEDGSIGSTHINALCIPSCPEGTVFNHDDISLSDACIPDHVEEEEEEEEIEACKPGYHHERDGCQENICQCEHGKPLTGEACKRHKGYACGVCFEGYTNAEDRHCDVCTEGYVAFSINARETRCIPMEEFECREYEHVVYNDDGLAKCIRNRCYCDWGPVSHEPCRVDGGHQCDCNEGMYRPRDDLECMCKSGFRPDGPGCLPMCPDTLQEPNVDGNCICIDGYFLSQLTGACKHNSDCDTGLNVELIHGTCDCIADHHWDNDARMCIPDCEGEGLELNEFGECDCTVSGYEWDAVFLINGDAKKQCVKTCGADGFEVNDEGRCDCTGRQYHWVIEGGVRMCQLRCDDPFAHWDGRDCVISTVCPDSFQYENENGDCVCEDTHFMHEGICRPSSDCNKAGNFTIMDGVCQCMPGYHLDTPTNHCIINERCDFDVAGMGWTNGGRCDCVDPLYYWQEFETFQGEFVATCTAVRDGCGVGMVAGDDDICRCRAKGYTWRKIDDGAVCARKNNDFWAEYWASQDAAVLQK